MPIGDAKPGDPTRTLQQIVAASGCGYMRQEFLPVDEVACSAEIKAMMEAHMPHCGLCRAEVGRNRAP